MTRLTSALRLELTLQARQKFLHAACLLRAHLARRAVTVAHGLRPIAEPYVLLGDTCDHRVLLHRRHGVLREAGAHDRCSHLDPVAVLGVPVRETD